MWKTRPAEIHLNKTPCSSLASFSSLLWFSFVSSSLIFTSQSPARHTREKLVQLQLLPLHRSLCPRALPPRQHTRSLPSLFCRGTLPPSRHYSRKIMIQSYFSFPVNVVLKKMQGLNIKQICTAQSNCSFSLFFSYEKDPGYFPWWKTKAQLPPSGTKYLMLSSRLFLLPFPRPSSLSAGPSSRSPSPVCRWTPSERPRSAPPSGTRENQSMRGTRDERGFKQRGRPGNAREKKTDTHGSTCTCTRVFVRTDFDSSTLGVTTFSDSEDV